MKTLLLVPKNNYPAPQPQIEVLGQGLPYLAGALRKAGHEVFAVNINYQWCQDSAQQSLGQALLKAVLEYQPQLIAIGGLSADYSFVRDAIDFIRKMAPHTPIVCGGGLITYDADFVFELLRPDFALAGDAEETLPALATALERGGDLNAIPNLLYWKDGTPQMTRVEFSKTALDDLPWPDYAPFDFETYWSGLNQADHFFAHTQQQLRLMPISLGRSCPFQCTFCCHAVGPKYRARSVDSALAEIRHLYQRYEFNFLFIYDELFALKPDRLREFCSKIIDLRDREGIRFDWTCDLRVNNLEASILREMKAAGCAFIGYGFESASPRVLQSMRKGITPKQIRRAIDLTSEAGIGVQANFIFGDIAETAETIQETMSFFDQSCREAIVHLACLAPYPGSQIFDHCLQHKLIPNKKVYYEQSGCAGKYRINMTQMPNAEFFQRLDQVTKVTAPGVHEYLGLKAGQVVATRSLGPFSFDLSAGAPAAAQRTVYQAQVLCPHCQSSVQYRLPLAPAAPNGTATLRLFCSQCHRRFTVCLPLAQPTVAHFSTNRQTSQLAKSLDCCHVAPGVDAAGIQAAEATLRAIHGSSRQHPVAPSVAERGSTAVSGGAHDDWQSFTALALAGLPHQAISRLASERGVEAGFYLGAAYWIDGQEHEACKVLAGVDTEHARNLLALIRKPQIQVLAQSAWLPDQFEDPKFFVRRVGIPRKVRSIEGWEIPNPGPLAEPFRRLLPDLHGKPPPDFYVANMLEWEILPYDLEGLPCPVFGVTSDFDIHLQNVYSWLPHFDELITVGTEEQQKVAVLSGRPVSVFPKMFPLPTDLPPLPHESRWFDLYISGTIANPYHPDKAALLHQLLQRSASRICYVDGFVHAREYYEQMGRSKASFAYVRHGTSMPSRGLEALAMGCAVIVQEGSALTQFAGENEGVLNYNAEAGELPAALDEILRHWPDWERRARRGAAIVRREFTRAKCLSQFLRHLTILAAQPRPERSRVETVRYQKRGVLRRGHCYSTPIALGMLCENLNRAKPGLTGTQELHHTLNRAREIDLFLASDLPETLKGVDHGTLKGDSAEAVRKQLTSDRERLQQTAADLYAHGLRQHPDSLVLQFNAFRHAVHLGRPEEIPAALARAQEAVNRPMSQWQVEAMDDVFPWDYQSALFNYRAYLDTLTDGLASHQLDTERLKRLLLAALHGYLGLYNGQVEGFESAAALDPEFPLYRLRLAQALERRGRSGDLQRAADLLAELALGSMLIEISFAGLVRLRADPRVQVPAFKRIESVVQRLRNISESSSFASDEYGAVSLVLPPGTGRLPLNDPPSSPARESAAGRPSSDWQSDRLASHRVRRRTDHARPKILLIPFECANWQNARSWSYTGYYAFEEGLRAAGAEFLTLPAIAGFASNHPASWLNYARQLCHGQKFDQAWIWITHNDYHPDLFNWLAEIAPVRLGVVMESLGHTPEELSVYTKLPGRRERVMSLLRHLTGVLAFDEADAEAIGGELPLRTLWCPPVVPWRCVCDRVDLPPPGPAMFQGTLYSPERQAFLRHPELKKCLVKPAMLEDGSSLPARFDQLQLQVLGILGQRGIATPSLLDSYVGELRRLRRRLFGMWLAGINGGYATVNLPSVYKGFAGRVVESMAAGRPVVSWAPPRARTCALFVPDQEILLFDRKQPEELRRQIDRLQKDPAFARSLAERAREKVLRHHTAEVRVRQILDWIEDDTQPDYGEGKQPAEDVSATEPGIPINLRSVLVPDPGIHVAALAAAEQAVEQRPDDAGAWTRLARTALQAGRVERFDSALARAMELNPNGRDALKLLGDLCVREGQVQNAVQNYYRILQSNPDDVPVLYSIGFTLEQAGEWESAFSVYDHLMRVVPQDTVLAERVARLRQARGLAAANPAPPSAKSTQPETLALKEAVRAPSKEPQRPSPGPAKKGSITLPACALVGHIGPARELIAKKKLAPAWQSALATIQARPFHPEAYLLLAEIAQAAGDSVSARLCGQHARKLAPGWKPARKFLNGKLRGSAKPEWLALPDSLAPRPAPLLPRLTVCLIVKDEERFLGQCLASVRGVADQIVVVDTGSTDRTVAIAKEHGAEVHHFAWCDDFGAARNAALEHATGDWVLMLDADEELPFESHGALRKLLSEPAVMAWRLPIIDVGREAEGCCYVPRLFRNAPALFYIGRVHEQVFTSIEVRRQEWGLDSRLGDAALRHHGYLPEVVKDRNKIERNLLLLEKAIVELPDEPNLLMNYGLELVRSGQRETGMDQYRKAFDLMSAQAPALVIPETREMLLTQLCTQLTALRRFDEIIRVLTSPLAQSGGLTASLHFSMGLAYLELKQPREAADQMRKCLAKRDQPSLAPINPEIRKAGPHHCLALSLTQLGESDAAADEFRLAIKDDPQSRPARFDYARFLATRNESVEALNLLFELANQKGDDLAVWLQGAQIALSRPEFLEVALDWTAEAQRHFSEDRAILRHRAEALTLANRCEEALPLWRQLSPESDPAVAAALVLCELVANDEQFLPPTHREAHISREFLQWYQRLIKFNGRPAIEAINARIESLQSRLPSVAHMLREALAQAQAVVPA